MVFDKSKVPAERLLGRNMNIEIYHLLEGADQAQGLAVVIDVFRAFSLECYLFSRGVQKIYAVGREETAPGMLFVFQRRAENICRWQRRNGVGAET